MSGKEFDLNDLGTQTFGQNLTHGDIYELHEGFEYLCGKGKTTITARELEEFFESVDLELNGNIYYFLDSLHQDGGSGELSFRDFVYLSTIRVTKEMRDEMAAVFERFDKKKKGEISKRDFFDLFYKGRERSRPEEVEEFCAIAESGNQTSDFISYKEFLKHFGEDLPLKG